jgi:signal transduction histidine kinase
MNNLSIKNRIAFYYIISAALLIFVVFFLIYNIVSITVNTKINDRLKSEVTEYQNKLSYEQEEEVKFIDHQEWENREHNEVSVDPVFLQITDNDGNVIEKSSNLKSKELLFEKKLQIQKISNFIFFGKSIRQIQVPLFNNKKVIGYLMVAVSIEEENAIQEKLSTILFVLFTFVLVLLFIIAQFIAGRSMKPIYSIITVSDSINNNNLKNRIPLPENKDELYKLSKTINNLLDRIENTIEREKQFTSDASHELRTPLAVIKGTLEVLIRKPRNTGEYQEKVIFCISEVDKMNYLVDQLLLLARFENQKLLLKIENQNLNELVNEILYQFTDTLQKQKISILQNSKKSYFIATDKYLLSIVIHNLISNAIKYSKEKGIIKIDIEMQGSKTILKVLDQGIGISKDEIEKVFNAFYRTIYTNNHPEIKGIGLGLSIAKRLCNVLNIKIEIASEENIGTSIILSI